MTDDVHSSGDDYFPYVIKDLIENYDGTPIDLLTSVKVALQLLSHKYPEFTLIEDDFRSLIESYGSGEFWTLDEAFGLERPPPGHRDRQEWHQFRYQHSFQIWLDVQAARADIKARKQQGTHKQGESAYAAVAEKYSRRGPRGNVSEKMIEKVYGEVNRFQKKLRKEQSS